MTGKTDVGRSLDLLVLSPCLKIGVLLATFHEPGNWLVSNDVLNRKVRVYNVGQSKLQKVTRDIVDPKALRCLNLGKCIPDIFQLNCLESELSPIVVNFKFP